MIKSWHFSRKNICFLIEKFPLVKSYPQGVGTENLKNIEIIELEEVGENSGSKVSIDKVKGQMKRKRESNDRNSNIRREASVLDKD